ncbi:hypothetical protein DMH03_14425 [Amycolatopsis sp. WAC 01376]|nr:hypothetical protein DMH03_14425 [Amycolatopsis sp. WAC 01376]
MAAESDVRQSFDQVRKCVLLFGVVSAIVLATVAAVALTGGSVNTFMGVRAVILLLAAPLLHGLAAREERKSLERLRVVSTILPIAIVGVDLIPGVCPSWYTVMQAVSAVPLIAVAVITRRRVVRAAR